MNEIFSDGKTILLTSDFHQEVHRIKYLLKHENYDEVVILGDELDSFDYNSEDDLRKTLDFIKENIFKENFHFLWGNHTLQYFWGNPSTRCSGYYAWKDEFITKYLGSLLPKIREKYLWYLWIDDYFCSHSGLHPSHLSPFQKLDKKSLSIWLDEQIKQAETTLIGNGQHWLYGAGRGRGGQYPVGGLDWLCWDSEFTPIEELSQIVGHTTHRKITKKGNNLNLDCHLSQYLLIKNNKLEIKNFRDL